MTPLFLLLLVGVVTSKHIGNHANVSPMITASQERRICADLCSAGLGGDPCGEVCFDLLPKGLPRQLPNNTKDVKITQPNTRTGACPLLCENQLGYPLCQCPTPKIHNNKKTKPFKVDFGKICDYYCQKQRWWLRGCPVCNLAGNQHGVLGQDGGFQRLSEPYETRVDWGKWCDHQCAESNGGSACNCDLLPFSAIL